MLFLVEKKLNYNTYIIRANETMRDYRFVGVIEKELKFNFEYNTKNTKFNCLTSLCEYTGNTLYNEFSEDAHYSELEKENATYLLSEECTESEKEEILENFRKL